MIELNNQKSKVTQAELEAVIAAENENKTATKKISSSEHRTGEGDESERVKQGSAEIDLSNKTNSSEGAAARKVLLDAFNKKHIQQLSPQKRSEVVMEAKITADSTSDSGEGSTFTQIPEKGGGKGEADIPNQDNIAKSHIEEYKHLYLAGGVIVVIAFACGVYFMKKGGDLEETL